MIKNQCRILLKKIADMIAFLFQKRGGVHSLKRKIKLISQLEFLLCRGESLKTAVLELHLPIRQRDGQNAPSLDLLCKAGVLSKAEYKFLVYAKKHGCAHEAVKALCENANVQYRFRRELIGAVLQGGVLCVLIVLISLGIGVFVLPRFEQIVAGRDIKFPVILKLLDDFGRVVYHAPFSLFLAGFCVIVFAREVAMLLKRSQVFRRAVMRTLFLSRGFKEYFFLRWLYLFAAICEAPTPRLSKILLAHSVASGLVFQDEVKDIKFREGSILSKVSQKFRFIPSWFFADITAHDMRRDTAQRLIARSEKKFERDVKAVKFIETAFTLILAVWVGAVTLSLAQFIRSLSTVL